MALVTLEQALAHLKLTGMEPNPADLSDKIAVAEEVVRGYVAQQLGDGSTAWVATVTAWDLDADPPVLPPKRVQQAVLIMLGYFDRYRGDDLANEKPALQLGELPYEVTMLLYPLRDPAVA